jgi:hypothetical protein
VVAAVAALNRLELAGESVRAVLEALTAAHPDWLAQRICVPDFARRYGKAAARAAETTIPFQAGYARRAGVEGTMHQAASHGARRARYRGLPRTRLDHIYMACALNLLRLEAFWTGTPLDRQRTSHLARLELSLAA